MIDSTDNQKQAFDYLRARVLRAHHDGDGLLVNNLCALALSRAEELAKTQRIQLTVSDLRWAFILPYFWLIDDYMPRSVANTFKAMQKAGRAEGKLVSLIAAYHYLVDEPLDNARSVLPILSNFSFDEINEVTAAEDTALCTNIIELTWFRTVQEAVWLEILERWINSCPRWMTRALSDLKARLILQSRLTSPGNTFPTVNLEEIGLLAQNELGILWFHLLTANGPELDQSIERLNATTSPDSVVARVLFDFHHFNRFFGKFGEPQEVGLTRRRLFTSSSQLLIFNEIRESHLSELLGSLFRRDKLGQAADRFRVFRLAMLCEISALRLWDWGSWQEAVKAQAEANLEVCKWDPNLFTRAVIGISQLLQALSFKTAKDDALVRTGIATLEFASPEALNFLVEDTLLLYRAQKRGGYELFEDL